MKVDFGQDIQIIQDIKDKRYVCVQDIDGSIYVDVDKVNVNNYNPNYSTGISGIPTQKQFPVGIIKSDGCCFLCICVKGGLTTIAQCMNCFKLGIDSRRIDINKNCYVRCNKEIWAKEIAQKYGTQYHEDYQFRYNGNHFWLTQNGIEIFNSIGIGFR